MRGQTRYSGTAATPGRRYTYYVCPHDPSIPRHVATCPDHPGVVNVREDDLMAVVTDFFTQRVFGPDRAALLAEQLPKDAADQAARREHQAAALRKQLAKIDVAENALVTELETPADPTDKAAQALRNRIRARFTDLYQQRTKIETELAKLDTAADTDADPSLLDELASLGDVLSDAPDRLKEALFAAFDLQALYNKDMHQVTIWATLTDSTPHTVAALLTDPRTDNDTTSSTEPGNDGAAAGTAAVYHSEHNPGCHPMNHWAGCDGARGPWRTLSST